MEQTASDSAQYTVRHERDTELTTFFSASALDLPTVLVTDPDQRAALAAARALAKSGHVVLTIGRRRGLAGSSSAVRSHIPITESDAAQPERFRARLAQATAQFGIDVILPVTDAASTALLGHDAILGAKVAGPSRLAYERASNKESLLAAAQSVGLAVPRQLVAESRQHFNKIRTHLQTPVVVKPTRSVTVTLGVATRHGVSFAADEAELTDIVRDTPDEAFPLLLQERTVGDGVGVFVLRSRGSTLMTFGHRRIREKPPSGGVSTYRESIRPQESLLARCESLLDSIEYDGAAMIEFKQDMLTGEFILMEINARLWGSLQLALDSGLDFPTALVALTLGQSLPSQPVPSIGQRTFWEFGELDHALAIWRKSGPELHAPPGMQTGARAALRALLDRRWSDHAEVFRWKDPLPFLAEAAAWLRRA